MALCSVKFTQRSRKCLGTSVAFITLVQALLGLALMGLALHFHLNIQWKLYVVEGYNFQQLFIMILVMGALVTFLHFVGAKICYDCGLEETRTRFSSFIFVWVCFYMLLLILELAGMISCFVHKQKVAAEFESGFIESIDKYLMYPDLKALIDKLQMQSECCGAISYQDWFTREWVLPEYNPLTQDESLSELYTVFYRNAPEDIEVDVTKLAVAPFSCCNIKDTDPKCYHDYSTQPKILEDQELALQWWEGGSLYQNGCVEKIVTQYNQYLTDCGKLFLAMFGFQFIILLLTRFLQTAIHNLEIFAEEDSKGVSLGWLF